MTSTAPHSAPGSARRTVLLVEDDAAVRRVVRLVLEHDGFTLVEAPTGREALAALGEHRVDVVLLDLTLPDQDGLELCGELRRRSDAPVIMVTARNDSHDVVAGLEAGADDYVTKPFVPQELAARLRALLRRVRGSATATTVRVGDLEISPRQGVATRDGTPVPLTRTEFSLLCELAADPGRALTREELLQRVWGYGYFGDTRLVDVHVRRLRTKVETDPGDPQLVLTVRGVGYRLGP